MVKVKDLETLMDDFMLDPEDKFFNIKPYLLAEFDWKTDPLKRSQFQIRGIPIEDNRKLSDIFKSFLPEEVITLKEI
ncbi:MAG: hypothetical protein ACFFCE_18660 [Promethearchaeota archaeon]